MKIIWLTLGIVVACGCGGPTGTGDGSVAADLGMTGMDDLSTKPVSDLSLPVMDLSAIEDLTSVPDLTPMIDYGPPDLVHLPSFVKQNGGPAYKFLDNLGIWGSASDDIYFVGSLGRVYHSIGNGKWTQSGALANGLDVTGVWGTSDADIYATVGSGVYHSDGTKWVSEMSFGSPTHGVFGDVNGTTVYVVADQGRIFFKANGQWNSQTSGSVANLLAVWEASPKAVYAVGANGALLFSSDASTWSAQVSNVNVSLRAIWGSAVTNIYIVGDAGTILRSKDGMTWVKEVSGTGKALLGVWGSSDTDVWAVGGDVNGNSVILHSKGDGQWTPVASPVPEQLTSVWGTSAMNVYIAGTEGIVLHGP